MTKEKNPSLPTSASEEETITSSNLTNPSLFESFSSFSSLEIEEKKKEEEKKIEADFNQALEEVKVENIDNIIVKTEKQQDKITTSQVRRIFNILAPPALFLYIYKPRRRAPVGGGPPPRLL